MRFHHITPYCLAFMLLMLTTRSSAQQVLNQPPAETRQVGMVDTVYRKIISEYADSINADRLIQKSLNTTLGSLDPYSELISRSDAAELNVMLKARFGGVGMVIRPVDDAIVVGEVYRGAPADKAGIKPGDIIIKIGDSDLKGKTIDDAFPILRGEPGTTVKIVVQRYGVKDPITKSVVRETIKTSSVPYYGLLKGNIGYIRLTGESETSSEDVKKALVELKQQPLKGLILDLRGNTGGLLTQAIHIVNLFIDKGKPVITERTRHRDTTYTTLEPAIDTKTPLAILTDNLTVSAGEIISGAIQDYDRGIIIGQKTFGKGLVQRLFNLSSGEILRLTTAYYYTPSGRCIQNKAYSVSQEGILISDSLKKQFKTANGRKVIDHDGISPDIFLEAQPPSQMVYDLFYNDYQDNLVFKYVMSYYHNHKSIPADTAFKLGDEEYADFVHSLQDKKYDYQTATEQKINELKKSAIKEGYWESIKPGIDEILTKLRKEKENDLMRHKEEIMKSIRGEIVLRYYYRWGQIGNSLTDDSEVAKASAVLFDNKLYLSTLGY